MKDTYLAVRGLMEQSGITWTEHDGVNITVESESTWEAYVKVCSTHPTVLPH